MAWNAGKLTTLLSSPLLWTLTPRQTPLLCPEPQKEWLSPSGDPQRPCSREGSQT